MCGVNKSKKLMNSLNGILFLNGVGNNVFRVKELKVVKTIKIGGTA